MNFKTLQNGFVKKAVSNSMENQATSTNSRSSTTYFASARLKNEKLRNYFDDDDDEVTSDIKPSNVLPDSDDFDPLDAFMYAYITFQMRLRSPAHQNVVTVCLVRL